MEHILRGLKPWLTYRPISCHLPACPGRVLSHLFPWSLAPRGSSSIHVSTPTPWPLLPSTPSGGLGAGAERIWAGHGCLAKSQVGNALGRHGCTMVDRGHVLVGVILLSTLIQVSSTSWCRSYSTFRGHLSAVGWGIGTMVKGNVCLSQSLPWAGA